MNRINLLLTASLFCLSTFSNILFAEGHIMKKFILIIGLLSSQACFANQPDVIATCGPFYLLQTTTGQSTTPKNWVNGINVTGHKFWIRDYHVLYSARVETHSEGGSFIVDQYQRDYTLKISSEWQKGLELKMSKSKSQIKVIPCKQL